MLITRRILHHGPHPDGTPVIIDDRAVRGCWFELHRHGGCGAGELQLLDSFLARRNIEPGDWISCEGAVGDRWYLGRVESCRAESPTGLRLQLEGMAVQLNEVFPGGFGSLADGVRPHRYAATDLFPNDPDRWDESFDVAETVEDVVRLLLEQYVVPASHIAYVPSMVESPLQHAEVTSLKFRGEETVRTVIKDLATRAQGASWGVNAQGEFYFLRPRDEILCTYREGVDVISLEETRDREYLYNRLLLTGDYVYDQRDDSDNIARRAFRWRANFVQPASRLRYGERRIRLWLPWIRTQSDSRSFAREFFRTYANPQPRYRVRTASQSTLVLPWTGRIALRDRQNELLTTARIESIRIAFDRTPSFEIKLGPENPRELWPEPPQDERWEAPEQIQSMGGPVTSLPTYQNSGNLPPDSIPSTSQFSEILSSLMSSDHSSDVSSDKSSDWSSSLFSSWYETTSHQWSSESSNKSGSQSSFASMTNPESESASASTDSSGTTASSDIVSTHSNSGVNNSISSMTAGTSMSSTFDSSWADFSSSGIASSSQAGDSSSNNLPEMSSQFGSSESFDASSAAPLSSEFSHSGDTSISTDETPVSDSDPLPSGSELTPSNSVDNGSFSIYPSTDAPWPPQSSSGPLPSWDSSNLSSDSFGNW